MSKGKYSEREHAEMLARDCLNTAALRARDAAAECAAILDRTPDPTEENFRPGMRLTDLMTARDRERFKQATLQIECLRVILEANRGRPEPPLPLFEDAQ